jgi:hypothetical protein
MAERKASSTGTNKQILEAIKSLDDKVTTIKVVLDGTAEQDKPGLMERVRKLEQWVESEKKLTWLIVSIIIADIVTRLWSFIAK